ncbi:MAG: acyl-CoA dehydrogenase [Candidatus Azotimanducaceae bacterium]|jgi:acyl-CoA dehydrogenase
MPDNLSESLIKTRTDMAEFINKHIPEDTHIYQSSEDKEVLRQKIIEASKEAGFYYKTQADAFGGKPATTLELTMLREQLAAVNSEYTKFVFGPGPGILHKAEGFLKSDYLEPLLRGEKRMAFGFTEPEDAIRPTYAVLENEYLTVTGRKSYITGGVEADFISILVNLEDTHGEKLGTAMVVVDKDLSGVSIEKEFTSMEGGDHLALRFNAVKVKKDCIVGKPGEGMPRALGNIADVRLMVSAQAIGTCMWVIDYLEKKLSLPHRSGQTLGSKEGVRLRLADCRIDTYVARSALYRTARLVDGKENSVNEISVTKVFCTEVAGRIVDQALQLVGGQALVVGHPLEKVYRQVRSLRLIEGANDLLRLNIVKGKFDMDLGRL